MSDSQKLTDIAESVLRIEERQAAYEQVAHRILGVLQVHNEKLDAILTAAGEPGPSPVQTLLGDILESMRAQEDLLRELPTALAETLREEMEHDMGAESDPAGAEPHDDRSDRYG